MTAGLQLGAPGVYPAPARVDRSFRPVRLDVAGFVGVAPRGPVDEPVLVQSWSDYLVRFGGLGGPGLLPFAVSAFFEQGGERAWVVRVAPREGAEDATARHELAGVATTAAPVQFAASDEGAWGGLLRLRLDFEVRQQFTTTAVSPDGAAQAEAVELDLPDGSDVPRWSLLRLRGPGLPAVGAFRWVRQLGLREVRAGRRRQVAVIDRPLDAGHTWGVAVVTASLVVEDPDPDLPRYERVTDLGLHPGHPRFLARVVDEESLLVTPVGDWTEHPVLPPDPLLPPVASTRTQDGRDRYQEIVGASFFDGPPGDPPDPDPLEERPHHGADRLARVDEIGLLAVPDLFWSGPAEERVEIVDTQDEPDGASFGPCPEPPVATTFRRPARQGVLLDPRNADELDEILARQRHLVELAQRYRRFVVLLDVPQKLAVRAVAQWRSAFDSSYAAAYHPWLSVNRTVVGQLGAARDQRRDVPPSAFAAGIIAARERRFGLSFGAANELARGAVLAVDLVTDAEHDVLHQLGVNVYRAERDGFRLTAARTLSRDRDLRQLSVRRLLTMLRLVLERQAQWVVFEPNTGEVREVLRNGIVLLLSELYRAGAFAGATEEEAFYVLADDSLNPRASLDLGRLVVEVGVAPAEPLEFLVLRISRDGDGGVRVEEDDRGR